MTTPLRRSPVEIKQDLRKLKFFWRLGQHLGPGLGEHDKVFESDSAQLREVNPRLDAEHHPRSQHLFSTGSGNPGGLVNLESDSVTKAMEKGVSVARIRNHFSGHAVQFLTGHSGTSLLLGSHQRIVHDLPHIVELLRHGLDTEGSSHVGTVSPKP